MAAHSAALQSGANILDRLISEQVGAHGEEASELYDALARRATHPLRRGGYIDAVARRDDLGARARGADSAARARALGVEPRIVAVREAALPRGVAAAIGSVHRFHAQGLLPELGLAWISLDVDGGRAFELLLWDYEASPRPVQQQGDQYGPGPAGPPPPVRLSRSARYPRFFCSSRGRRARRAARRSFYYSAEFGGARGGRVAAAHCINSCRDSYFCSRNGA